LAVGLAPSVLADKPILVTPDPDVFIDVDPCTGELHEFTIYVDAYEHAGHKNNFVVRIVMTGFTDSGYEMFAGGENVGWNKGVFGGRFKDMWRHDDGRMFEVSGLFVFNGNQLEVKVDKSTLRCIGGETILP
jgi:hypothetical protein